jgi:aldose 1-epimerase
MRTILKGAAVLLVVSVFWAAGCAGPSAKTAAGKMDIAKADFGMTSDGKKVDIYTLTNSKGMEVKIINYGGTVVSLRVPDRNGKLDDIVLGFGNIKDYEQKSPYFGCIIGRYGNRIGKGQFTLDGVKYQLATNDGENHLHGGLKGFDKVVWDAEPIRQPRA